jgi:hypothetical protein
LESFSYELQFDMHFYMHSYLHKKIYSCKKWVLHGYVGPFGLGDGAFEDNMIDLSVIVCLLPLVIKIGAGASSDCKNFVVGEKLSVCCEGSWICSRGG